MDVETDVLIKVCGCGVTTFGATVNWPMELVREWFSLQEAETDIKSHSQPCISGLYHRLPSKILTAHDAFAQ